MGRRLIEFWRANAMGLRVVASFIALIFFFFFLLTWGPIIQHVDAGKGLAQLAAWMSYGVVWLLGPVLGYTPHRMGTIMGAGEFEVDVSPACSGAVPTIIYLSAVLAYPTTWKARAWGSLIGILVIHFVNVGRVVGLFLIGLFRNEIFHETHVYVAQALVICVAVALWLYWATRFADAPAR